MSSIVFVGEHARTYDVNWHSHEDWELVYCTAGEGAFEFENGTTMAYKSGDTVAIPPRELHANVSRGGFTNLHMRVTDPSFPYRTAFRVSDDHGRHMQAAFQQAKYYFLADIQHSDLVLSALAALVCSYIMVYKSNSDYSEPVDRLRGVILRHYSDPNFALDEAIRQLPFHYDYLRKLFKKEMGSTPLEYMTQLRMKKAQTMLTAMSTKDFSVSEVAQLCGYEDPLYFSRVFKKYYGLSPLRFVEGKN